MYPDSLGHEDRQVCQEVLAYLDRKEPLASQANQATRVNQDQKEKQEQLAHEDCSDRKELLERGVRAVHKDLPDL